MKPWKRRRPTIHLLVVDAEGHDGTVLEGYPLGEVDTWRVIFEVAHLDEHKRSAARSRLVAHGFRPLELGGQDDVWHHPDSREHVSSST